MGAVLATRCSRIVLAAGGLVLLLALASGCERGRESTDLTQREGPAGRILFWRDVPWPSLWSVRTDGTGLRRVYYTRQNAKRPRLSPDRRWIAFDGAAPGKMPLSDFDVQTVRVDGTRRRTLAGTRRYELDAQWSPDGKTLSYSSYRHKGEGDDWLGSSIWTVAASGHHRASLGLGYGARWSPDGKELVFSAPTKESDGDIFVMNADGTDRRPLLSTPELEQAAGWSPDGSTILFTRFDGSGADVMAMDAEGGNLRNLTDSAGFDLAAGWSPDGKTIVFTVGVSGTGPLFLMNADGSGVHEIPGGLRGSDPSWG